MFTMFTVTMGVSGWTGKAPRLFGGIDDRKEPAVPSQLDGCTSNRL